MVVVVIVVVVVVVVVGGGGAAAAVVAAAVKVATAAVVVVNINNVPVYLNILYHIQTRKKCEKVILLCTANCLAAQQKLKY